MSHHERLEFLILEDLQLRRKKKLNLIFVHKMISSEIDCDYRELFTSTTKETRESIYKSKKFQSRSFSRDLFFFVNRVASKRKSLASKLVQRRTLNKFKQKIYIFDVLGHFS